MIPPAFFHIVRLWLRCRGGLGGYAVLPQAGGLNDQPAWLLEAFNILANAEADAARQAADEAASAASGEA